MLVTILPLIALYAKLARDRVRQHLWPKQHPTSAARPYHSNGPCANSNASLIAYTHGRSARAIAHVGFCVEVVNCSPTPLAWSHIYRLLSAFLREFQLAFYCERSASLVIC